MTEYTIPSEADIVTIAGADQFHIYQASTKTLKKGTAAEMAAYIRGSEINTAITTVGAGTLTAAALVGAVITRSGSVAAYTDTTDTAANIIAAAPTGAAVNFAWEVTIKNTVAFAETIAAGTGVTLSGQVIIPPNSVGRFLLTYTSATTVSMQGLFITPITTTPLEANTAITTVGAGTLTAAGLVGGVITRSGSTAAYSDTTDTAANIVTAMPNSNVGQSWEVTIKNTVPFAETLVAGTGVTLSGQSIIPANTAGRFLLTYTGAGAISMLGLAMSPITTSALEVVTTLNTVGAGTVTAAGIAGGVTARGGAQSGSAFTDTTDTAANIIAAMPNAQIGQSFEWTYQNNTNGVATFANGTGVTVSGVTVVPANAWARYLVTYTAAATVTIAALAMGQNAQLPVSQFVTISAGNGTLALGNMEGAAYCFLASSGATAMTTRTAAQIIANIANAQIGMNYVLRVYNTNAGTLTLTGGTGVTITGTATIATAIARDYNVSITGAAAVTLQNVGNLTAS